MSGDHSNYYIIKNGQNTEKSPGDLRRLAVTQTPVKDHQLTLMWKTLISNNNNKQWNMQVTIIRIVIGAFGIVSKRLLKGLEDLKVGGRVETIQPTVPLRKAGILRRVLWRLAVTQSPVKDLQLKLTWETQWVKMIIN